MSNSALLKSNREKDKRVLLVIPPETYRRPFPNFGVLYMAAVLRQRGYKPRVLDGKLAGLDLGKLRRYRYYMENASGFIVSPVDWGFYASYLREFQPDVVGISATTQEIKSGAQIARIAKAISPRTLVVAGNLHPMALPTETLYEFPDIDVIICGEAEYAFAEFLDLYFQGKEQWKAMKGIAFRQGKEIVANAGSHLVENLDALPYPARDLLPIWAYEAFFRHTRVFGDVNAAGVLMTSRGCPSRCTFCTSPFFRGKSFRAQSADYVLREMKMLIDTYGVRYFHFWDDIFTVDKERTSEICRQIVKQKWRISFQCYSKVTFIDPETLAWMAKAGCKGINYGVESGSARVLKDIAKGITLERVEEVVEATAQAGINPTAGFMFGHPTDDWESVQETTDFAISLVPRGLDYAGFWIAIPYPGTPMFDAVRKDLLTCDWDAFNPMRLYEENPQPVYVPPKLEFDRLVEHQRSSYSRFAKALRKQKLRSPRFLIEAAGSLKKAILRQAAILYTPGRTLTSQEAV